MDQTLYQIGKEPSQVTLADINNDGFVDMMVSNSGYYNPPFSFNTGYSVMVLLNNGDGTFQSQVSFPVGVCPNQPTTADVNNDGLIDMLISNYGSHDTSVLINTGESSK
jgi:hypothetical protein